VTARGVLFELVYAAGGKRCCGGEDHVGGISTIGPVPMLKVFDLAVISRDIEYPVSFDIQTFYVFKCRSVSGSIGSPVDSLISKSSSVPSAKCIFMTISNASRGSYAFHSTTLTPAFSNFSAASLSPGGNWRCGRDLVVIVHDRDGEILLLHRYIFPWEGNQYRLILLRLLIKCCLHERAQVASGCPQRTNDAHYTFLSGLHLVSAKLIWDYRRHLKTFLMFGSAGPLS
jgi:hypothetical protein